MEINITWKLCRICLQEQNQIYASTDIDADMAKQILDMTGVMIKANDSLPQKICKKCLQVLKQAIHFCTTCRVSDKYLQNVLKKAKSFKLDKPKKDIFDDIIEEPTDDEHESDIIDKTVSNANSEATEIKEPHEKNFKLEDISFSEKEILPHDKKSILVSSENDLLTNPSEEALTKSNLGFHSIFLNNQSDFESDEAFTKTEQKSEIVNGNSHRTDFLQYSSLEISLDSTEENVHSEMLQSSNLSTVDMTSNDENNELFFIFSDNVIAKQDENDSRDETNTILVENISDMVDAVADDSDEERNFDDFIESDSNTFDISDYTDEKIVKYEYTSKDTTVKNENCYQQDDLISERILEVHYKSQSGEQTNDFEDIEENLNKYISKISGQSKPTNFNCQICGNHFNSRSLLKYHMRIIHRNERNYECELCGKRFTAACNLTTHIRTHTGEKPFVCQYCQRRFSDKSTHVKHERSHTDERPYSCTICQKAFTLSSSLKAHKRVHSGEKPFSCYSCGKSFKLPHQLKAHMSTNAHKIRSEEENITPD